MRVYSVRDAEFLLRDPDAQLIGTRINFRAKIAEKVHDPETRRKLTPHDLYGRRPICDEVCPASTCGLSISSSHFLFNQGYYEIFNQKNVEMVLLTEDPIEEFTAEGIKMASGRVHEFDVVIFATGFDAVDGSYRQIQ